MLRSISGTRQAVVPHKLRLFGQGQGQDQAQGQGKVRIRVPFRPITVRSAVPEIILTRCQRSNSAMHRSRYRHSTNQRPEQTVSVTKLLSLCNSGLPDWSVVCVSWPGFNYITLTASSDAADAIKDAFGLRVNCLWTVTAWPSGHTVILPMIIGHIRGIKAGYRHSSFCICTITSRNSFLPSKDNTIYRMSNV